MSIGDSRYAEALDWFQRVLRLDRLLRNRRGEATTRNNIGLVDWDLGRYADALDSYQKAYALKVAKGHRQNREHLSPDDHQHLIETNRAQPGNIEAQLRRRIPCTIKPAHLTETLFHC